MQISEKEKRRAEAFFKKNGISVDEIKSFNFMEKYHKSIWKATETPVMTFHLISGDEKECRLPKHQRAVLHTLIHRKIPFSNYTPQEQSSGTMPVSTYKTPGTQLFDIFIGVLIWALCYAMFHGYDPCAYSREMGYALCLLLLFTLLTTLAITYFLFRKLCSLRFEKEALLIRTCIYDFELPYHHIRKVTFRQTYSKDPRPVMDVIDDEFNYHTYYIGWVPFKRLPEITELLRKSGVDAVNKVDPKWYM